MQKNSRKKLNPWGGLGNYGAVPVKGKEPLTPEEELGLALKARYPRATESQFADAMQQEMGLNPYQIRANLNSEYVRPDALGQFSRETGTLKVRPDISPVLKKTTIMHELAHAADAIVDPAFSPERVTDLDDGGVDDSRHFSQMKGEKVMADSLKNQAIIEQGLPPDPQAMGNMPWLKQVAPLSSNKLANPWAKLIKQGKAVPPAAWNASYDFK